MTREISGCYIDMAMRLEQGSRESILTLQERNELFADLEAREAQARSERAGNFKSLLQNIKPRKTPEVKLRNLNLNKLFDKKQPKFDHLQQSSPLGNKPYPFLKESGDGAEVDLNRVIAEEMALRPTTKNFPLPTQRDYRLEKNFPFKSD